MKKRCWILDSIFFGFFCFVLFFGEKPTAILFIGNSYTYRNDMPKIFLEIAKSKGKHVLVDHCTQGKATLHIQSRRNVVYETIKQRKWDYIMIQASSRDLIRDSITINSKTLPALEKIFSAIKKSNPTAKKLFFMTWGYRNGFKPYEDIDSYAAMTRKVKKGYLNLKKKYGIGVVPVGMAWYNVRQKHKDLILYVKDGAHPSLKGSYLTACCFYAGIFKEKAVGSTYYSKLSPRTCRILQRSATKSVLAQKTRYGLIDQ